jgi:hypothetical protein
LVAGPAVSCVSSPQIVPMVSWCPGTPLPRSCVFPLPCRCGRVGIRPASASSTAGRALRLPTSGSRGRPTARRPGALVRPRCSRGSAVRAAVRKAIVRDGTSPSSATSCEVRTHHPSDADIFPARLTPCPAGGHRRRTLGARRFACK